MFTIKRPKSKRFFMLTSGGFGPIGKTKLEKFFNTWSAFFSTLSIYILNKFRLSLILIKHVFSLGSNAPRFVKDGLVKKLIWSRGKLGRPIATAFVLSVSLAVFFIGEFLSSFRFVVNQEVKADYLAANVDMIPKKETALTTIPEIRKRTEPVTYVVEGGDTLSSIGSKFKVSVDALKYVNSLTDNSVLRVGQSVTIPPVSGLIHTVKSGDNINSIAAKYSVAAQAIADFNYLLDPGHLVVGTELVIPGAKVPEPIAPPVYVPPVGTGPANFAQAKPSKNFCVWPSTVRVITQYFTWYHNGFDIATPWSSGMPPIFACTGGKVIRAGWDPWGLGLHVRIDHGNGYTTIYGHMSRLDVSFGQNVSRGQVIGIMGSTGNSTGPHVHFMVEYHGVPQNPGNYMN